MRPYSPGGILHALAPAPAGSKPPTPSIHRLPRGLPGYLIPFTPLAFAPQRQVWPSGPPSPRVFLLISTHFTATPGIPSASTILESRRRDGPLPVEPGAFTTAVRDRLRALTPSNSGQRLLPPSYRGCWHGVGRGFFLGYRLIRPREKWFTIRRPSSHTRRRCVRLSPIAQDSQLLPPVGVWAVSQSQCGRAPSQAGYPSSPWWAITSPTS